MKRPKGWRGESRRHRLAAKGIKTGRKKRYYKKKIKRFVHLYSFPKSYSSLPTKKMDIYEEYTAGKIEPMMVTEVSPEEFIEQKNKIPKEKETYLSDIEPDKISQTATAFLTEDKKVGVAVSDQGEIQNLFSLEKGKGKYALIKAIERGGFFLDCFDKDERKGETKGLPDYYKKFGFKEIKREKNWDPAGPDVVFMKR